MEIQQELNHKICLIGYGYWGKILHKNLLSLGYNNITIVDVVLDNSQNQGAIIAKTIQIVGNFFNPLVRELGQNVNTSELKRLIQTENGIVSVSEILFFNQVGGQYSSSQTSMPYSDPVTRQIRPTADTLFATPTQIYQIRYPNKDINIRVLNLTSVNFS